VALASSILAMPAMSTAASGGFRGLSYSALELLALSGVVLGWLLTDRIPAIGRSRWFLIGMVGLILVIGYHLAITGAAGVDIIVLGASAGSMVRGGRRRSRDPAVLVALAAMATWITYDVPNVLYKPMRDLHTYLAAAGDALAGHSAYLQGPLTAPPDWDRNPFVYPPFTLPLFEILARLPLLAVEVGWLATSAAAVLVGLRLIGVRGRWVVALLAWPVFAIGLSVGNVAGFGFLCLALGYRFAALLVVGGVFKLQSGIPSIWGIRERRYREVALGIAVVAVLVIVTIPLTGWGAWGEWARALGYFEQTLDRYDMRGPSLAGSLPTAVAMIVSALAIGVALLRTRPERTRPIRPGIDRGIAHVVPARVRPLAARRHDTPSGRLLVRAGRRPVECLGPSRLGWVGGRGHRRGGPAALERRRPVRARRPVRGGCRSASGRRRRPGLAGSASTWG